MIIIYLIFGKYSDSVNVIVNIILIVLIMCVVLY